jgi:hypothetical protein
MKDRAAKYAKKETNSSKRSGPILFAYVDRTPKGKIRLHRIGIRFEGQKEEVVENLPSEDPRYAFENDYKVRKATHDLVKKSAKFARFYDSSTRVSYDL